MQGERVGEAMSRLRTFMFEHVYLGAVARREHEKVERIVRTLFEHYCTSEGPPGGAGACCSGISRPDWRTYHRA